MKRLALLLPLLFAGLPAAADDPVGDRVSAEANFRRLHMAASVNEHCRYLKPKASARLSAAFQAANTALMRSGAWDKVQYERYFTASAPILGRVDCRDPLARRMVEETAAGLR